MRPASATTRRSGWALATLLVLLAPLASGSPDGGVAARPAARALAEVKLLYFRASWCGGCKRLDEARVVERLQTEAPGLRVERVDVDARPEEVERYGVEYTPTLLLVDADGFPLGKVRIELADPEATVARGVKLVGKATGR